MTDQTPAVPNPVPAVIPSNKETEWLLYHLTDWAYDVYRCVRMKGLVKHFTKIGQTDLIDRYLDAYQGSGRGFLNCGYDLTPKDVAYLVKLLKALEAICPVLQDAPWLPTIMSPGYASSIHDRITTYADQIYEAQTIFGLDKKDDPL